MSSSNRERLGLGVVLLAAGRSSRMGQPKMLLPWKGSSVIGHLIREWASMGTTQIAVVVATGDELLIAELDRLHFPCSNLIFNPKPERGMFSSIQCAASWEGWSKELTHWAVVLGDQPHLSAATLNTFVEFVVLHPAKICQPSRGSHPRHPVILPRASFLALSSSQRNNLKEFLSDCEIALCEIDDPALDMDIDSPCDYREATLLFGSQKE